MESNNCLKNVDKSVTKFYDAIVKFKYQLNFVEIQISKETL